MRTFYDDVADPPADLLSAMLTWVGCSFGLVDYTTSETVSEAICWFAPIAFGQTDYSMPHDRQLAPRKRWL